MIKVGQIYKQLTKPYWRKNEAEIIVITNVGFGVTIIDTDGLAYGVGDTWIKGDCLLIAEYDTWQEAVNSKEFRGENYGNS